MIEFKKPKRFVEKVFIHCSDSDIASHDDILIIKKWHVEENGWSDVGYHYFITKKGELQTGRDINTIPSAQKGHNACSIAICVSGAKDFTEASFVTLRKLCNEINVECDKITFWAHNEVDKKKTCPVFNHSQVLNLDINRCIKKNNGIDSYKPKKLMKLNFIKIIIQIILRILNKK